MSPASTPMITPELGDTNPHAGVITTSPATAPEQKPSTLGCPFWMYSAIAHVNEATAVASVVVVKALAAIPSPPPPLPPLNPYHPTHSMPVPIMHSTMLCGSIGSFPKPVRLPMIRHSTSADQPDDMWTTVPPAKSIALIDASAFQTPFIIPEIPQTMCASGK